MSANISTSANTDELAIFSFNNLQAHWWKVISKFRMLKNVGKNCAYLASKRCMKYSGVCGAMSNQLTCRLKREIWLSWRHHQMETFSALVDLGAANSPVTGEFPSQRPVARIFDVYSNLHLNTRLSEKPRHRDLKRHRVQNDVTVKWTFFFFNLYKVRACVASLCVFHILIVINKTFGLGIMWRILCAVLGVILVTMK